MPRQRVIILGSTGSIGCNSLKVLSDMTERFEVVGLACGSQADLLAEQAAAFRPKYIAITDGNLVDQLARTLGSSVTVLGGSDALVELIETVEFDCVVVGVAGAAALLPTIRAVELGKRVALANKESLVIAGSLISSKARESGARIIPVDSEHSGVFQALHAGRAGDVRRVVLTASGGPFRTWSAERMGRATVADALEHPIWDMGPKITIDSATMMNKALEIVEARWLFDLKPDQIEVIIHPESIVHSLVEFLDGSVVAQLGMPDMRTPIQYALTYPARLPCGSPRLELAELGRMQFFAPDGDKFPAIRLGHEVAGQGGTAGAVLNAADESAVQLFRDGAIGFSDITTTVEDVLGRHAFVAEPTYDQLMDADEWAREEVLRCKAC